MIEFFQSDAGLQTLASGCVTLAAVLLTSWLQGRARLIVFSPNSTVFTLPIAPSAQPVIIQSGQVVLQNQGRQAAEQVEIVAMSGPPPADYKIIPYVGHTTELDPSGRWKLVFPFIAPKEVVTVQILNGAPIDNVRSKTGPTTYVPVMYQRILPNWFNGLATILFFIGIFSLTYGLLRLVTWLASGT